MGKNLIQGIFERINGKLFFSIIVFYQLVFVFQGMDICDGGWYAYFYQHIFKDPQTVHYQFLYWFSGIMGGAFMYLFPKLGLLGIRLEGVLITTLTILIVYNLLKEYLNKSYLKLGLLLVTISISNDPKELNYNNLSALFFVLSVLFLFVGLKGEKLSKIFLSGVFISLNFFTRMPNVVGLMLSLAIVYYWIILKYDFKYLLKQVSLLLSGFILTTIVMLFIMKLINHYDIYIDALVLLNKMGKSSESTHNALTLIKLFFRQYSFAITLTLIVMFLVLFFTVLINYIDKKIRTEKIIFLFKYFILFSVCVLTIAGRITLFHLINIFAGTGLIAGLLILFTSKDAHFKLIVFLGIELLLLIPLGSDGGLYSAGKYSLWLIFPIAIDYFFWIKSLKSNTLIYNKNNETLLNIFISEDQFNEIRKYLILIISFLCFYFAYFFPYFDLHNRIKMHYSVQNRYLKGIFSTKERADVMNELLIESSKYLKPNDYVLAYSSMPMFHYLTETKPFMDNSWPWLCFDSKIFNDEWNNSLKKRGLPVVVMQKLNTIGSNWPDNTNEDYSLWQGKRQQNDSIINAFLMKNNYKLVWENIAFKILIPHSYCKL